MSELKDQKYLARTLFVIPWTKKTKIVITPERLRRIYAVLIVVWELIAITPGFQLFLTNFVFSNVEHSVFEQYMFIMVAPVVVLALIIKYLGFQKDETFYRKLISLIITGVIASVIGFIVSFGLVILSMSLYSF